MHGAAASDLVIERARIVRSCLFDVGDEILLDRAEQLLGGDEPTQRLRLSRGGADALAIKSLPLDIILEPLEVEMDGGLRLRRTSARLFDYGTVSVRYQYDIPAGTPLTGLLPVMGDLFDTSRPEDEARATVEGLIPRLGDALLRGSTREEALVYTVLFVEAFAGHPTAAEVLEHRDVLAKLLQGEVVQRAIAPGELDERFRYAFSYLDDDLVVVDSEVAFVLEPSGSPDVPDTLELAAAHLIGLRCYDEVLDRELARIVDDVGFAHSRAWRLVWSPYSFLASEVQRRWLEITEVTERIDNSIKVVGDAYLARVYRGALDRFGIPLWRDAVMRKQARIAQLFEFLIGQLEGRRMVLLELAIVVLIVLETLLFLEK